MSDEIRVFDMDDHEQDMAWAKAKYGVAFRRAKVAPGQKVYRLVELREKTGHSSLITQVLNEDGYPMANVDVTFYWSGAPDPPDPPTTVYPHDWHPNFVHGPTNVNGDVGPGMGHGAYHGEGEGGPHAVWMHDPNIPSDICEKLGMLAGTFHDHLDQKFQLKTGGENGNLPWFVEAERIEETEGVEAAEICLLWPKKAAYDTASRGGIVGGQELETSDLVEVEHNGEPYVMSRLCCDFGGDPNPRTFWMEIHSIRSPDYVALSGQVKETFNPKPDFRRITYVFAVEENQPPIAVISGPASGLAGETLSFSGSGSSDSDGSIVGYAWDFGDGTTGSGVDVTHSYGAAGSYTVTLTVTDDGGLDGSATQTIQIDEAVSPVWTMTVDVESKLGTRLLIGILPEAGVNVRITDSWGNAITVVSGSKPEHGPGAFEIVLWHPTTYTIGFLDQQFELVVSSNVIIRATFEQTEDLVQMARLVSCDLKQEEAEALLQELEDEGFGGIFTLCVIVKSLCLAA